MSRTLQRLRNVRWVSVLCALWVVGVSTGHASSYICHRAITVCSSYEDNKIAFHGRVLETTVAPPPGLKDGSVLMAAAMVPVRFTVLENFQGAGGGEITLLAPDRLFQTGKEYLVFANPQGGGGVEAAWTCNSTHEITTSQYDPDLNWLRGLPTSDGRGYILGKLNVRWDQPLPEGVHLRLTGDKVDKQLPAGKEPARFDGLTPGSYTVTAIVPEGFAANGPIHVELKPKSCEEADFLVTNDSHLSGHAYSENGEPVKEEVYLLKPERNRVGFSVVQTVTSQPDGSYEFKGAPPGHYWVALTAWGPDNRTARLATFYPDAHVLTSAELIDLPQGGSVNGIDLKKAPPLTPVTVHVAVSGERRWDGVSFLALDPIAPAHAMPARADAEGRADITLYAGRTYTMTADTRSDGPAACGGPVTFTASDGLTVAPLVLNKTTSACRRQQHNIVEPQNPLN